MAFRIPGGRIASACAAVALLFAAGAYSGTVEAKTVVIQRTTIYINTLPKGCVQTVYNGGAIVVWHCGTYYYQPYKGRYVRVYIK